ncbi:GNAT family N-acetyltransferase [Novosphingobium album (ex Hu et al. 2023)]|uniref:GNAT family N-acetyltransferase n=1 Tax=Novosphingobium album (ex Hu et al. 2023) TaxID=2930093 RepID=A0ABT0B237_9SPHN|nr:GNAT family N-acetyltransferase [Novosphingobium album (ex Hu et al. 2023)]MCJ2178980.1 GNAT family N-acetyltransferase [Novosphingobium album (ex Hu et al. 2023)]
MRHEQLWDGHPLTAEADAWLSAHDLPCDARVAQGWRRLEAFGSLPSQTLAFHAALSETMMTDLVVSIATAGSAGDVTAILPLCRRRGLLTHWHAAGVQQVYEPVDALCASPAAAAQLAASLSRLRRPLQLDRIPAASPLVPALASAIKGKGLVVTRPATACPRIVFEPGEAAPEQRFNSGRRSDFRRARRRAEAMGEVSFEMHAPCPETFDRLFDEAVAVEQRGWKGESGSALGCEAAKGAFFRDFLCRMSRDGNCRIAFMRIGGRAVAMHLAVVFQGRYWLFKIGFDGDYARCSPGNLLMLFAMSDAMKQGLGGIELLGEVEDWISEVWTQDTTPCVRLQTYPFNLRGLTALLADAVEWAWHRLPFPRSAS